MSHLRYYLLTDPKLIEAMNDYTLALVSAKRVASEWLKQQGAAGRPVFHHDADRHVLVGFEFSGEIPKGWRYNRQLLASRPEGKRQMSAMAKLPAVGGNPLVALMLGNDALFRGFRYEACDYFALCRVKAVLQAPFKPVKRSSYLTLLRELRARRANGYFHRPGRGA